MDTVQVRSASYNGSLCITVVIPAVALGMPKGRGELLAEILEGVVAAYDEEVAKRDAIARIRLVSRPVAA